MGQTGSAAVVARLLTLEDVGEVLGQGRWTVLRRVHAGELRAIKVGDGRNPAYRVRPEDLERYLEARLTTPTAPAPRPRPMAADPAPGRRRSRQAGGPG